MEIQKYIDKFGDISELPREVLLQEMDHAWEQLHLDNDQSLEQQTDRVALFYSHPVWTLNGIFSEVDAVSRNHRIAITKYLTLLKPETVADYGGGSGVLAKFISAEMPDVTVEIIEPHVSPYFLEKLKDVNGISFKPSLNIDYDIVIAQDVLEHVDNPVDLALELIRSTKMGGYLVFANCFSPDIKCHLPKTFYLRHTFSFVMFFAGLYKVSSIPGAKHAIVYQRKKTVNYEKVQMANKVARLLGPTLNLPRQIIKDLVRFVKP